MCPSLDPPQDYGGQVEGVQKQRDGWSRLEEDDKVEWGYTLEVYLALIVRLSLRYMGMLIEDLSSQWTLILESKGSGQVLFGVEATPILHAFGSKPHSLKNGRWWLNLLLVWWLVPRGPLANFFNKEEMERSRISNCTIMLDVLSNNAWTRYSQGSSRRLHWQHHVFFGRISAIAPSGFQTIPSSRDQLSGRYVLMESSPSLRVGAIFARALLGHLGLQLYGLQVWFWDFLSSSSSLWWI